MGRHIAIGLSTYPQTHCMPGRRHQVLWTRYIDWLRLSPILVLPEVDPAPPRRKWPSAHLSGAGGRLVSLQYNDERGRVPSAIDFLKDMRMTRFLLAGAAALGMMMGVAAAQTTSSVTTTTTAPTPLVVPSGTSSTTTTEKSVAADGTRTDSSRTTYGNSNGVASDSVTRTTTYPPPVPVTTTQQTTTTITR